LGAKKKKNLTCPRCAQGLVTLFVMIGLGTVFGLPYLVARNRRRRNGKMVASSSNPINNILDLSRKRGHTQ